VGQKFYAGTSVAMTLNSSGNVGINESNPSHRLHINGGSNDEARVRVTNTANGQASLDLDNGEGYFRTYTDAGEYRIYDQTDGDHRLIIDTSGNVGIGTTSSPGHKLEVTGSTSGDWISLIENTHNSNGYGLKVKAGDNNDVESFRVANIANDNLFNVKAAGEVNVNQGRFNVTTNQNANFVAKFINNAGGGYGIGMDMAAGNHFFFYRSGSGTGSITDNGSNVSYNTSSDYRLKENIVDLDGSVDRLKQLQPRRFNFIGNDELGVIDGFIAHEVQAVIPDAVQGEKDAVGADGNIVPQAIDQSRLVPLLTAALQEALIKIEQLEARVDELENK
jgi:hypothetical protein